jgi:alanine dehydrogenase
MKWRAVIMDLSIDQGGCVETSRPTTLEAPTFIDEDVIHYCVPNMSSAIARTASHALTYAVLPYVRMIAHEGIERALHSRALQKGMMLAKGAIVSPALAAVFGRQSTSLTSIFRVEDSFKVEQT